MRKDARRLEESSKESPELKEAIHVCRQEEGTISGCIASRHAVGGPGR